VTRHEPSTFPKIGIKNATIFGTAREVEKNLRTKKFHQFLFLKQINFPLVLSASTPRGPLSKVHNMEKYRSQISTSKILLRAQP